MILNIFFHKKIGLTTNKFFIAGGLRSRIFDNFSKLQVLNLQWNRIFGKLPSSLFKCKELTYLSLYHNALEGSIPREIENLPSLEYLYLDYNNLKGKQFLIILFHPFSYIISMNNCFKYWRMKLNNNCLV